MVAMILNNPGFTQDRQWWNKKHNWDGVTPWWDFIKSSAAFMGPNALPIPKIKNGTIPRDATLKIGADYHNSNGDKTEDLSTELYVPLFSPRVGLNISFIPIEHYEMDTLTRDLRRARTKEGKGNATGDVYIGTYIQLAENHHRLPDILLTINLKTASGTKLSDARNTDAPGYYFDVSFGKSYSINQRETKFIKPYAMIGFYVWQLHGLNHLQNDAVSYGLGFDLQLPSLEIKNAFGGYYGYIGNGDRPAAYRLTLTSKFNNMVNYQFEFQKGMHDNLYTTYKFSWIANLSEIQNRLFNDNNKRR